MNDKIKDIIQDCNVNFLIGSGLSRPFLKTLGSIEVLLADLEDAKANGQQKKLIRCSLYKKYFDGVIAKNVKILDSDPKAANVLSHYCDFLKTINSILLRRKSTILSKQVNLFTTNIDIFIEKALEDTGLEYNDGFNGRFKPVFALSNFKKSYFKKSLHYDNTSEIPVFNLLKLHGSLSWRIDGDRGIGFCSDLRTVKEVPNVPSGHVLSVGDSVGIEDLVRGSEGLKAHSSIKTFLKSYEKLLIVNPTKEKFKYTLLNQTYYEMLRIYSNELEKENTVLFVMGFSFADEHIREITLRCANSNPTLMIYVIAHSSSAKEELEEKLDPSGIKNNNLQIIAPPRKESTEGAGVEDEFKYTLANINKKIFDAFFQNENEDVESA